MDKILSLCRDLLLKRKFRKVVSDPLFPLSFWLMNVLELNQQKLFRGKPLRWVKVFLSRHLDERAKVFKIVRESIKESPSFSDEGGYCHHCGQCCFFFGGLGIFPENWPFNAKWKSLFTDGIGKFHIFCAFLWERNRLGKSLCAIYKWRPVVCDLFGEEECKFYLEENHLPMVYLDKIKAFYKVLFVRSLK